MHDYINSGRPIMASHYGASLRDPDRIQTCNLLIRSQMLYSVELRSQIQTINSNLRE